MCIRDRARTEEYHALLFRKVFSIGELLDEHQHCNLCVIDLVRLLCEELHDVEDQEDGFVLGQIVFTDFKQGLDALILHLVIACHQYLGDQWEDVDCEQVQSILIGWSSG